ncbi:MAG: nucleotidyltransferase family protein [Hydrogenophaga sp.]|uniref:nucleotidyltransferase family protein n=1 Tax=Hydrogenophaga sp. TaxID=1904254 RepID=UPI002735AD39|nr:nucleotidyltransferase family protein [Hydrogenophaga sp.]MDP3625766.1 nucleotidyltransferase family protein [Hydrogenophaga sp.]MDZ4057779.1 nucleotidyltransferase family protein [Polynucleobacter sp.]
MKNWQSLLVTPDTTLEVAVATLDHAGARIVVVVDDQGRLLGTVTDGDVRRALLKHLPLTEPVANVMWKTPLVAGPDWSRERMRAVMENRRLLQMPIVDSQGVMVGLETLHDVLDERQFDNPVFLMAGGFGTRLYPLTENCPKPMLKVGDKPILELILESFVDAGFHRFYISTHYLPEMIRDHFGDGSRWGVSISYIYEEEPLGTGGALGLLPKDDIQLPMFLMNGDLLTRVDYRGLLEFHAQQNSIATMCVREYKHQVPYGVVQAQGAKVVSMVEKPTQKFFVNAGIYVLSPELLSGVQPGKRIDMPTVLEEAIRNQQTVSMFPVHEYWLDIGRMEDFQRAQEQIRSLI